VTRVLSLEQIACEIDERTLFSDLSTTISSGELVQVVGPNGAGKTTLLRAITGTSQRYSGDLRWCGHRVPSYEFYSDLLYLGHLTGVKASLTASENLSWYFGLNGIKSPGKDKPLTRTMIVDALAKVGLVGYEDVPVFQMSAGQKRRVALARLHISEAPLWVLDEPFTAIDKRGVEDLEDILNQHCANGGIVILTTHQSLSRYTPKMIDLSDYAGVNH